MRTTSAHTSQQQAPAGVVVIGAIIAMALGLLLAPVRASAADTSDGFSVSPLQIEVNVKSGGRSNQSITVTSTMEGSNTFRVGTEDVAGSQSDPDQNPVLLGEQVDSDISGADWLDPSVNSFTLKSGQSKTFNVLVTAPSSATGGHYAAVTVTSESRKVGTGEVTAQSRVAVLFMINAGDTPPPELVIDNVTTTTDGGVVIDYINKGSKAATPAARIEYVDAVSGEVVRVGVERDDCGTALPGGVARCTISGDKIDHQGDAIIEQGTVSLVNDGRTVTADLPTTWKGSSSSLVLPAIGAGILMVWFWRRRRGRALPGEVDLDDATAV